LGKNIQPRIDRICEKYNLSTLEKSIEKTDKKEWDVLKDGPFIWNEQIKQDIDACVLRAADYSMFLQMLEAEGYEIKQGKYLAVKPPGMERFRRTKTLGQGYGIDELKERI
jgi:Relaxase/Mobilisation nuclease domain.